MARGFLERVLPQQRESEVVVLASGPAGPQRQSVRYGIDALVEASVEASNQPNRHWYFTPARYSFDPAQVDVGDNYKGLRRAVNATAKRCYTVDVDLNHDTKPSYSTKSEGVAAMMSLVGAHTLPMFSYCVDSGRGLHFYWVFERDVPAAEWKAMADALKPKLIAADPKLFCDPTRLADLASYFRLPGSWNPKSKTQVKIILQHDKSCMFKEFEQAAGSMPEPSAAGLAAVLGTSKANLPAPVRRTASAGMDKSGEPPIEDPMKLMRQCLPLGVAAVKPDRQDYETWFGAARLFSKAAVEDEGRAAFHAFSKAHPGYKKTETDAKFNEALTSTGYSPTCSQMRTWSNVPAAACRNCPLYKKQGENGKPVVLQAEFIRDAPAALTPAADDEAAHLATVRKAYHGGLFRLSDLGMADPIHAQRELREGQEGLWCDTAGRLMLTLQEDSGMPGGGNVPVDYTVASGPIWVVNRVRFWEEGVATYGWRVAQGTKKIVVEGLKEKESYWQARMVLVPSSKTSSSGELLRHLVESGFAIKAPDANNKGWRRVYSFLRSEADFIPVEKANHCVSQLGWDATTDEPAFIIGDRRYTPDGGVQLVEHSHGAAMQGKSLTQTGSLTGATEAYRVAMGHMTITGKIMMLAALAAPLTRMSPVNGALFYTHGTTGAGKSLMMSHQLSLYGSSDIRIAGRGHDTANSLMNQIGTRNSVPFFVDEITTMDNEQIGRFMLTITDGRERGRMEASVNAVRESGTWETMVFATSNVSLDSPIEHSATGQAQMARTIGFNAATFPAFREDTGMPIANMVDIEKNHGQIGVAFIRYVLKHYEAVQQRVAYWDAFIRRNGSVLGSHERKDDMRVWRAVAAIVLVTAEITTTGIPNHEGMHLMNESSSFLQQIEQQLIDAAESHRGIMGQSRGSVEATEEQKEAGIEPNNTLMVDVVLWLAEQGKLSVYAIHGADGAKLATDDVVRRLSKTDLVHTPAVSEACQMHVYIGQPYVDLTLRRRVLQAWARASPDKVDAADLIDALREDGKVVADNRMVREAKLRGDRDAVTTVTGAVLPSNDAFTVRMNLTKPATDDLRLEWA